MSLLGAMIFHVLADCNQRIADGVPICDAADTLDVELTAAVTEYAATERGYLLGPQTEGRRRMSAYQPEFRRNDQDRKPPRRVLTGYLLGDPPADLEERRRAAETRKCAPETGRGAHRKTMWGGPPAMIRRLLGRIGLLIYPTHRKGADNYHRRDLCPRCAARRMAEGR